MKRPLCIALMITSVALFAMAPAAMAEEPSASEKADAALQKLLELPPDQIVAKLKELRDKANAAQAQANKLDEQAKAKAAELKALQDRLATLQKGLEAAKKMGEAKPESDEKKDAKKEDAKMMEGGAVMAAADEKKVEAEQAAVEKITYAEHIQPIFKSACLQCHNQDKARGGLALDSFDGAMYGGSSGEVIAKGNPSGSRLLKLVRQEEEPKMPPSGLPLAEKDLELIRKWISMGAPKDSGSEIMEAKDLTESSGEAYIAAEIGDGPPPMPEVELEAPIVTASRGVVARAVATSPTSPLAAVGGDRQVILYNLEDFSIIGALPFPEGDIFTMTFSRNGEMLLAAGGQEGNTGIAVIWHVRTTDRVGTYGEAYDTILAGDISPDQRMVALGGPSKKARVYSVADGSELYECDKHTDWIYAVRFTPDGEVLTTADRGGGMHMWQAANGRYVEQLRGHEGPIHDLAYTLDSKVLASAGADGTVRLWDTWKFNQIRSIGGKHSNGPVLSVDFHERELVTSGRDGRTLRMDLNGEVTGEYEKLSDWVYQADYGKQGAVVLAGSWDGQIVAWDKASGERKAELATQPSAQKETTEVAKAAD